MPGAAAPLPLPIFGAHTLQGAQRAAQAETCPRTRPRVTDRGRHLDAARRGGGRAAEGTDRCPSPAARLRGIRWGFPGSRTDGLRRLRGSYLLLIRQLLLQIRHFPSGDKPLRRRRRRPPDFPLSVRSSTPRAPAQGGAPSPHRCARALGAPPPSPQPAGPKRRCAPARGLVGPGRGRSRLLPPAAGLSAS